MHPISYSTWLAAPFSKREIVGCDAKRAPANGIAAEQQFLHRIVGQPIAIIRIGIAAGQPKDPLG